MIKSAAPPPHVVMTIIIIIVIKIASYLLSTHSKGSLVGLIFWRRACRRERKIAPRAAAAAKCVDTQRLLLLIFFRCSCNQLIARDKVRRVSLGQFVYQRHFAASRRTDCATKRGCRNNRVAPLVGCATVYFAHVAQSEQQSGKKERAPERRRRATQRIGRAQAQQIDIDKFGSTSLRGLSGGPLEELVVSLSLGGRPLGK